LLLLLLLLLLHCNRPSQGQGCLSNQIPLYRADGQIQGCQASTLPCPINYPISLRTDFSGKIGGCLAFNASCPANYLPLYGYFTALSPTTLTITNCWSKTVATSCGMIIDVNAQPAGMGGTYGKQIVTINAGVESIIGCIINSAQVCPSDFPFRFLDFSGLPNAIAPPTTAVLDKCAPANAVTTCPANYWKSGYSKFALTACIKYYTAPGAYSNPLLVTTINPLCPPDYPTVAIAVTSRNPLDVTVQEQVVGCYSADTYCYDHVKDYKFTLIATGLPNYCTLPLIGLQSCGGFPGRHWLNPMSYAWCVEIQHPPKFREGVVCDNEEASFAFMQPTIPARSEGLIGC
jgi:hypothetical protein